MAIRELPATAIHTIGASQVLIDPASVVKELVDNALDARATSIFVEISANTLDTIQVRDNGHGVPPADRPLLARPHCTSKIANANDLRMIGGSSLGFRGEALASIAELSGSLIVSTRVEGEQMATTLTISRQDECDAAQHRCSFSSSSLPVGTSVKVIDFLKRHPVRKQQTLKTSEKCLKKIKHLLQSVTFARPHVRLSLRVIKVNNDKNNWTYTLCQKTTDTAIKIVGAACVSQCALSEIEENGWKLLGLLPKAEAITTKICGFGAFISIDGRPLSVNRGISKQVLKTYREVLRKAGSPLHGVKDPFIYIQIHCPSATYDVNIEPAKDDVLFEEPQQFLTLAERLFDTLYNKPKSHIQDQDPRVAAKKCEKSSQQLLDTEVDLLLSTELEELKAQSNSRSFDPTGTMVPTQITVDSVISPRSPTKVSETINSFSSNMYGEYFDEVVSTPEESAFKRPGEDIEDDAPVENDVSTWNPWTITKFNASSRRSHRIKNMNEDAVRVVPSREIANRDNSSSFERQSPSINLEQSLLLTSRPTSSSSPCIPMATFRPANRASDVRLAIDGEVSGTNTRLAAAGPLTPFSSPQRRLSPIRDNGRTPLLEISYNYQLDDRPKIGQSLAHTYGNLNGSQFSPRSSPTRLPRSSRDITPLAPSTTEDLRHKKGRVGRNGMTVSKILTAKFKPPRQIRKRDDLAKQESGNPHSQLQRSSAAMGRNGDMRKYLAPIRTSYPSSPPSLGSDVHVDVTQHNEDAVHISPQKSCNEVSNVVGAVGQEIRVEPEKREPSLTKVSRRRSSRLPLELTPAGQGTHNISITLQTDVEQIRNTIDALTGSLGQPSWSMNPDGRSSFAAFRTEVDVEILVGKLVDLLSKKLPQASVPQNITILIRDALRTHQRMVDVVD